MEKRSAKVVGSQTMPRAESRTHAALLRRGLRGQPGRVVAFALTAVCVCNLFNRLSLAITADDVTAVRPAVLWACGQRFF